MSLKRGHQAEALACRYLQQAGLQLLEKNYRCPCGEIDLIMQDGDCLVFVEVRMRSSGSHGGALASITQSKQRKILRSAEHYLVVKKKYDRIACRVDVITLQGDLEPSIDWIKNAIECMD